MVTSPPHQFFIGDSLNQFIEAQLLRYTNRSPYLNLPDKIFKDAFSESFEEQCIALFRSHGFHAGHILESGMWKTQENIIDLNVPGEKLYGEIDVFAHRPDLDLAVLVECKVLLDVQDSRSYQNLASKLKDDSEGYRLKLRKKAVWLERSFMVHEQKNMKILMVLVTDISLPILGIEDTDVVITDYTHLQRFVRAADSGTTDAQNFLKNNISNPH